LRETVKQEREPCPGPPSSCPGSFASPLGTKLIRHIPHPTHTHTHTYDALRRRTCVVHDAWRGAYASVGHNPCPGPGILTWFPFAGRCDAPFVAGATLHRLNDV
jgi:hypothetical protein